MRRAFPRSALRRIEQAICGCEREHRAELRFAVEGGLDFAPLWRGVTPRQRAEALFSALRVWDAAASCGVLIYVQLVDRSIEIVVDRGVSARVPQADSDDACRHMEAAFVERWFENGSLAGIRRVSGILVRHFPPGPRGSDELPNQPVII